MYGDFRDRYLGKNLVSLFIHDVLSLGLFGSFSAFSSSFSSAVVLSTMTRIVMSRSQESVVLIV